jgi:hypothetical protein
MAGFDFVAWRERSDQMRRARREELRAALAAGLAVYHLGRFWTTAGVIRPGGAPFYMVDCTGEPRDTEAFAAFIEPYGSDPVYLANHIENRESLLGFETWIVRAAGRCWCGCGSLQHHQEAVSE